MPPGSRLFVISDGTYEILRGDGGGLTSFEDFTAHLAGPASARADEQELDSLLAWARDLKGGDGVLDDDFSILKLQF